MPATGFARALEKDVFALNISNFHFETSLVDIKDYDQVRCVAFPLCLAVTQPLFLDVGQSGAGDAHCICAVNLD
jgi:hypothetical protein